MPSVSPIDPVLSIVGNAQPLEELRRRIARRCVVPFVGAGLSVPFGYPQWGALLRHHGAEFGLLDEVNNELAAGRYEEAAGVLVDSPRSKHLFQDLINLSFGPTAALLRRPIRGAVQALASMMDGPVVTTNYDEVLEQVYAQEGRPFERVARPPDHTMLCEAFSGNRHYLLKIHGDCNEPTSRILTLDEYTRFYGGSSAGEIDPSMALPQALRLMFQCRSVLFLGCSLEEDRYLRMLRRQVSDRLYTPLHFAVLEDRGDSRERRQALSNAKILPIFFPPGRFDLIETVLDYVGDRLDVAREDARPKGVVSSPPIASPAPVMRGSTPRPTPSPMPATAATPMPSPGGGAFESQSDDEPSHSAPIAASTPAVRFLRPTTGDDAPAVPPGLRAALAAHHCVAFVGSGASVDAGLPTWAELARDLVAMAAEDRRVDAATVAELRQRWDRGELLWVVGHAMTLVPDRARPAIKARFDARGLDSPMHDLLAKVPFRAIVTGNYDTFLESRRPGSRVLVPRDIAELGADGERTVLDVADPLPIIKIHGTSREPEQILFGTDDYDRFVGQHPGYREFLVQLWSRWTVLFFGTSLRDVRVLELLAQAHARAGDHGPRHFAVFIDAPSEHPHELRDRCGIEAIDGGRGLTQPQARAFLRALAEPPRP